MVLGGLGGLLLGNIPEYGEGPLEDSVILQAFYEFQSAHTQTCKYK